MHVTRRLCTNNMFVGENMTAWNAATSLWNNILGSYIWWMTLQYFSCHNVKYLCEHKAYNISWCVAPFAWDNVIIATLKIWYPSDGNSSSTSKEAPMYADGCSLNMASLCILYPTAAFQWMSFMGNKISQMLHIKLKWHNEHISYMLMAKLANSKKTCYILKIKNSIRNTPFMPSCISYIEP